MCYVGGEAGIKFTDDRKPGVTLRGKMTEDEKVVSFFGRQVQKGTDEKISHARTAERQKAFRILAPAIRQLRQLGLCSRDISSLLRFSADEVGDATDDAGKPPRRPER
jgi:hypothetical protein